MSNKRPSRAALLAHKKQLLEEIQYSQKGLDEIRKKLENKSYYDEPDRDFLPDVSQLVWDQSSGSMLGSDSEDFFPNAIDKNSDINNLKLQHSMLKICKHATQELTGLIVLQSEVNVLVEDPHFEGERPITEPGTWREVTAECRINLVPFTISFFTHTGLHMFAPTSYRGLKTSLVKTAHEAELSNSVLQNMRKPSDAVEVIRSYSAAYKSRRTTLAHLANKYAISLFMEPHPEGGFVLKCANLLEILWRLENKWSPLVPFHHRMKFDLEYMDESYVKIITQAHKELLDPSIQTDERTLLLAKIISTCLEARGPVDSESDLESVGVMSKQTDNQKEMNPKNKDMEVMAPPKKLPKKTKTVPPKDLSADKNTALKRGIQEVDKEVNAKKMKPNERPKEPNALGKKIKTKESSGDLKNDKEINDIDNIGKDNEGVKKKSNEKTDIKKTQINKDNNNLKKSQQNNIDNEINNDDSNKKTTREEIVAKKKKQGNNIEIETGNVNSQKQIKNTKTTKGYTLLHNIETGLKFTKSTKAPNKNDKLTKATKRQRNLNNDIDQDILNKTYDIGLDNHPKNVGKYNENEPQKKMDIKAKIRTEIGNNDVSPKTVDEESNISNVNDKKVAKERNKNDNSQKKTVKKANNGKENTNLDNLPKAVDKQSKISNANDNNVGRENNKKEPPKVIDNTAKKSLANDKYTEKSNKTDAPSNNIDESNAKDKNGKENQKEIPPKKINKKAKMAMANDKRFDIFTKKITIIQSKSSKNKDINKDDAVNNAAKTVKKVVANEKEVGLKKSKIIEKISVNTKTKDTFTKATNIVKNKNTANTDMGTDKNVVEKNLKTINHKESVRNINKPIANVHEHKKISLNIHEAVAINKNNNKILPKITTKSVRNAVHKSPMYKNQLKLQNLQKAGHSNKGIAKMFSGNTEKDNLIQKKTISNEINFKNNMLRISPRNLSSKFKTNSKELMKKMLKNTNIPRLMKKPVPKTSK